nr:cytochrome P450 CYP72A219-like [Ipomoea batatas]
MEMLYNSIAVSFAVIVSTLVCKFLNWVWFRPKRVEKVLRQQGFSGNSYKLLIGNLIQVVAHSFMEANRSEPLENLSNHISPRILPFLYKTITAHGKKSFVWLGPKPAVLILEPEMIKEILGNYKDFERPSNPAMMEMAEGSEVDVWPYVGILTSDAIARVAFGSNFEEGRNIFEKLSKLTKLVTGLGPFLFVPQYWNLPTKMKWKIQQTSREVRALVRGVVEKRMKEMRGGEAVAAAGTTSSDLLGISLESNLNEIESGKMNNKGLSGDDVIEECKLFYLAGQESSTNFIAWTLILLGKHLEWQQRLRDEVIQVFGSATIQPYDFHKLNQLKIMNMIFHEVLRLYPPLPVLYRVTNADSKLGNITLPAGVDVIVPLLSLHVDKDLWGDDALEFKP